MARQGVLARLTAIVLTAIAATATAGAPASTRLEYMGAVISDVSSDDTIVKGDQACFRNDFAAAMTFYRVAAQKKDPTVQAAAKNRVGILYERAFGVPQDYAEALKWFQQAAALGNGFAQGNIGDYYFFGIGRARSFPEALRWYRMAAEKDVPLGVNQIAWIYLQGLGVEQNTDEARRWYLKGAMLDSATAEFQLGWMYAHIAPFDYAQAMKWYRKAATHGDATARNNIGYLYENGLGVGVDYKTAARWYSLAAGQGHPRAMFHLGSLFDKGLGAGRDPTKAEQLMEQSALGGDADAQAWLAAHWWRRLAPRALLGIAVALFIGWAARRRVTRPTGTAAVRLHHPANALIVGLLAFVFFGSAAIISNVFPNPTTTWWTTTIFVGFAALSLPLLLDYFLTWYDVSADGLDYGRLMGGRDHLKWALVRRITYSRVMNWFRLETDSGRVARVPLRLVGVPEFARIVLRGVSSAAISPGALLVLRSTANETPPTVGEFNTEQTGANRAYSPEAPLDAAAHPNIGARSTNRLAFNTEISTRLRVSVQIALGALPLGLMFASFIPLFHFESLLNKILGIPASAPIKSQPHGYLWLIVFLAVMVAFMIAGYLIGWVLNAALLRTLLRWPAEKVRRLMLYSEVPVSWLKANRATAGIANSRLVQDANWAITRQKGMWRYVLQRGVLAWGLPMYLVMACLPAFNGRAEPTASYFLWQACLWALAGAVFGLLTWFFYERNYRKRYGKQTR
jgi:TPR repeat protein